MHKCSFCPSNPSLSEEVLARNGLCLLIRNADPVLASSVMIVPVRHVATPFDLTREEWLATRELLIAAKRLLDRERPDGYSIGWNVHPVGGQSVPHVHLHVIARLADEPLAVRRAGATRAAEERARTPRDRRDRTLR